MAAYTKVSTGWDRWLQMLILALVIALIWVVIYLGSRDPSPSAADSGAAPPSTTLGPYTAAGREEDSIVVAAELAVADSVAMKHGDPLVAGEILWGTVRIRAMYAHCRRLLDTLRDFEAEALALRDRRSGGPRSRNGADTSEGAARLPDDSLRILLGRWDDRLGTLESLFVHMEQGVTSVNHILYKADTLYHSVYITLPYDFMVEERERVKHTRALY